MRTFILYIFFLFTLSSFAQNISVNHQTFSTQELIEDILINSGCIENINVTQAVSGDFNGQDKSYGYFENNGGSFPFSDGIVMSTGKLSHVPGPNNNLSDDDAPGWGGDADLEQFLNISHTVNATIIEFDFMPNANNIKFRYIFASEEYRENNSSTCQYSDAFAFLIKPVGGGYENIAVIPGTNIPVKVTTVHPEIPGGCSAENEAYFGSFNDANAPINFNGQTAILTATTQVTPGTTYHIKLVIADEKNYRYDSAVFLEGKSFNIGANLGDDITGLCEDETYILSPEGNGITPENYHWYKIEDDGSETLLAEGAQENSYEVSEEGTYKVMLDYGGGCTATDEIEISYVDFDSLISQTIYSCDTDENGFSIYNLPDFNSLYTQGHQDFAVAGFFLNQTDAKNNSDAIENPEAFHSTTQNQEIYVRIVSNRGCSTALKITLSSGENDYEPVDLMSCVPNNTQIISFNLTDAIGTIQETIGQPVQGIDFYESAEDANAANNKLDLIYSISVSSLPHLLYARIDSNAGCEGIIKVILKTLPSPKIDSNYTPAAFCEDSPTNLTIHSGVLGNENDYSYAWENGETSPTISISEPGEYKVTIHKENYINEDTIFCTVTNTIKVVESEKPQVTYKLLGDPNNYKVKILASGSGKYYYSLDYAQGSFLKQNIYPVKTGKHTIYVKDINGCGIVQRSFYAVGFMKFFTPNADGYNDYWRLLGVNYKNPQVKEIQIFDRYGKLLVTLSPFDEWDGTFHGKPVYENDYWFKIKFKDGSYYTNHFTLMR